MSGPDAKLPDYPYSDAPRLAAEGPIDVASLTRAKLPLEIEIGPGRGMFILERVSEVLDKAIVGLEIRWKWATLVDQRLERLGFGERARVYAEDARFVLPRLRPNASVEAFFVHFPDPWWKKRQQKRLVVAPSFVREMVRLLVPGGMLFVQTDVPERGDGYETILGGQSELIPDGDAPRSARTAAVPWVAKSNREKRVIEAGLEPVRLRYRRR
jgi:tRNA (guanine-N7-)-methyltransferase